MRLRARRRWRQFLHWADNNGFAVLCLMALGFAILGWTANCARWGQP
jgi:hypothetical protein